MIDASGNIVTSTEQTGRCLNEYWQKVFEKRTAAESFRSEWLKNVRRTMVASREGLRPSLEDVKEALKDAPESSCGPDGIPFRVYKIHSELAAELLHNFTNAMLDDTCMPDDNFNLAFMICFPKEADGAMSDGAEYYKASGT